MSKFNIENSHIEQVTDSGTNQKFVDLNKREGFFTGVTIQYVGGLLAAITVILLAWYFGWKQ